MRDKAGFPPVVGIIALLALVAIGAGFRDDVGFGDIEGAPSAVGVWAHHRDHS